MKENSRTNKIVIIGSILCSLVLLGVLSTYSYILLSPTETKEDLSVGSGTLSLTFADNNPGFNKQLEFGSSAEKTFSITNDGTLEAVAKINWKNITNTYLEGSLTYSLSYSETEDGDYKDIITNEPVPRSETPSTIELANGLVLPAGKTYYYKLTLTLNYLDDVDQTADLSASLTTEFSVEEGNRPYKITFMDDSIVKSEKTVYEKTTYGQLPTLTKDGWTFLGWYTDKENGQQVNEETNVEIQNNQILYAHWKRPFTNFILSKANASNITNYNSGNKKEMFTFTHATTNQTPALTDYRYIGNTPNNYIKFNDETWRIIGVFTVERENNIKEQRIKIIREAAIGNFPWDIKSDKTYKNEWPTSTLATMLNGDYVNKGGNFTYVFYLSNGKTNSSTVKGLNSIAKNQIKSAKWYLGSSSTYENLSGPDYYNFERSTTTCVTTGNCAGETRSTNWLANVGLMYPSDYIYTYAYDVDNTCFQYGYKCARGYGGIPTQGWLYNSLSNDIERTITSYIDNQNCTFEKTTSGSLTAGSNSALILRSIRPTAYLRSDIEITGGDGSQNNMYKLSN